MKVKLREVKLKNNKISVMFDIHSESGRIQKMSGIKYADVPRNAIEREDKKNKKLLAQKKASQIEYEGLHDTLQIQKEYDLKMDFFKFAMAYLERIIGHCEIRTYNAVIEKFKAFLGKDCLPCGQITETMMREFKDYLESKLHGISAYNYFKKLKRIFREATIARHFRKDPTENIRNSKRKSSEKDILSISDLKILMSTRCCNANVKNSFLFSCFTGLRFCDVINLKWQNIKDGNLDIIQKKTGERVYMQLHKDAMTFTGERKEGNHFVFNMPSHTGCSKALKSWTIAAGIEKHVTFHCSRHSFACILLSEGVDIFTVSKLLGHKTILQTQTYLRIIDANKQSAIAKLPSIL